MNPGDAFEHPLRSSHTPGDRLIIDLGFAYWRVMRAAEKEIGMPRAQGRLLGYVARAGEIGQADLQRQLGIDGAAITRQVQQLEAEGLVTRRPDPTDNRVTLVAVTPSGREKIQAVAARAAIFARACFAGIDADDIATTARVLARMRDNVADLGGPPDPCFHSGHGCPAGDDEDGPCHRGPRPPEQPMQPSDKHS